MICSENNLKVHAQQYFENKAYITYHNYLLRILSYRTQVPQTGGSQ